MRPIRHTIRVNATALADKWRRLPQSESRERSDRDGDGIADGLDVCPDVYDPWQTIRDGDACDVDDDADGVPDHVDNCPLPHNPTQAHAACARYGGAIGGTAGCAVGKSRSRESISLL
jgi:hypothetical protein